MQEEAGRGKLLSGKAPYRVAVAAGVAVDGINVGRSEVQVVTIRSGRGSTRPVVAVAPSIVQSSKAITSVNVATTYTVHPSGIRLTAIVNVIYNHQRGTHDHEFIDLSRRNP